MSRRNPMFMGRCYLCGEWCGRTYCHEHRWAAAHLSMPYRRDRIREPSVEELAQLVDELNHARKTIREREDRLEAWREHARKAA